jgi:hypothetical protein
MGIQKTRKENRKNWKPCVTNWKMTALRKTPRLYRGYGPEIDKAAESVSLP